MSSFFQSVKDHFEKKDYFSSINHVLVAVSGGVDSMVLLHVINELKSDYGYDISVAHFQHHLRDDAEADAKCVQDFCDELNNHFYRIDLDPSEKPKRKSVEAWGREERYKNLIELSNKINADAVLTAHHGDDQIETILMRIGEGTGFDGLRGIREKMGKIIRPMLSFSKQEIQYYAEKHTIPFQYDKTNDDTSHPRNFLRHSIIPIWKKQSPHLNNAVERLTKNMGEMNQVLSANLEDIKLECVEENTGSTIIHLNSISDKPVSVKTSLVKYLLEKNHLSWRRHHWTEVRNFIENARTGKMIAMGEYELLKDRNQIIIQKMRETFTDNYSVKEGDTLKKKSLKFSWLPVTSMNSLNNNHSVETVDGDKIGTQLNLRFWENGDRFQPLGMNGYKKVSDFLIDIKMDRFQKNNQFVLANKSEVLWVCGKRISEKIKVTNDTTKFVELSFMQSVG